MKSCKTIEEYFEHIGSSKKAETRINILAKSLPLLEVAKRLHNKHKK